MDTAAAEVEWRLTVPVAPLWRADGVLQLGLEPPGGLLVDRAPRRALDVIGALAAPTTRSALQRIGGTDCGTWLDDLLGRLAEAGLLVRHRDDPPGAVTVLGDGRLAAAVTALLLDCHPAAIRVGCTALATEPRWVRTLRDRVGDRLVYGRQAPIRPSGAGDLTIVVTSGAEPERSLIRELQLAGVPHLVTSASDLGPRVGPLVVPGRGPCLRCEDLQRTARDPAWPRLLAQLCRPRPPGVRLDVQWASATTVQHALAWMSGALPDSVGGILERGLDHLLRLRPLRAHPGCGCLDSTW